jgi:hypothetical protein
MQKYCNFDSKRFKKRFKMAANIILRPKIETSEILLKNNYRQLNEIFSKLLHVSIRQKLILIRFKKSRLYQIYEMIFNFLNAFTH